MRNNCVGCANFVMILRSVLPRYCIKALQSDIQHATCIIKIFNVILISDEQTYARLLIIMYTHLSAIILLFSCYINVT